jgi:hypothetical protein
MKASQSNVLLAQIVAKYQTGKPDLIIFAFDKYPDILISEYDFLNNKTLDEKWFVSSMKKCCYCSTDDLNLHFDNIAMSLK